MLLVKHTAAIAILTVAFAIPKIGQRAPQFALPSAAGPTVLLKDYEGKSRVVLVFYRGYW
jgi:peroxiredoxin